MKEKKIELKEGKTLSVVVRLDVYNSYIHTINMHVVIRTFTGKIFTINVLPTDNIIVIKKEILLETGILVEDQRLTFLTNLLNDDDIIQNKRIRNEDTLYLHTLKYVCDS